MPQTTSSAAKLKVALAHDYLREYGGAERVLETLHDIFPDAPVYVSFTDPEVAGIHWARFKDWNIHESWMTRIPGYKKIFSPLRLFAPSFFSSFDLSKFDVVISSSNAYFAKAIKPRAGAKHICYCHTPARSLYGYTTMSDWRSNKLTHVLGTLINHYLRVVDYKVAQQVDFFLANSQETASRIKKFYRREATVIYPPVTVPPLTQKVPSNKDRSYYLYVNRLALAKHPEIAVQACTQMGVPLKVVGTGKMLEGLKDMAGPTVEFLGAVSDEVLHELYAGAKALLYPVEDEDFGIVPIEAMGHGTPVIAHASGGPLETIIEKKTGIFIQELSVQALVEAMHLASAYTFNQTFIRKHAQKFSQQAFKTAILQFVSQKT
jgi:glycosyltransferase involved in cell wall biosynthesis